MSNRMSEVRVKKLPDDPLCLRISMGGNAEVGYYCVYRGKLEEIKACMESCWAALNSITEKGGDNSVGEDHGKV